MQNKEFVSVRIPAELHEKIRDAASRQQPRVRIGALIEYLLTTHPESPAAAKPEKK